MRPERFSSHVQSLSEASKKQMCLFSTPRHSLCGPQKGSGHDWNYVLLAFVGLVTWNSYITSELLGFLTFCASQSKTVMPCSCMLWATESSGPGILPFLPPPKVGEVVLDVTPGQGDTCSLAQGQASAAQMGLLEHSTVILLAQV